MVATIDSILAQTRADWQMVVVDNGMSDEMALIIGPYTADPRIRLIRQENQRASGGVNAAGRAADGRAFAILHSDDLVHPTFLERLVPLLDASPEVDVLGCDAHFLAGNVIRRASYRGPIPSHYGTQAPVTLRELVEGWIPYYTALIRREAWEAVGGFRHDAPSVEDLALWIDLVTSGHVIRVLDEPLAIYREDDSSDSRSARGVETMEEAKERVLTEAVQRAGDADDRAALEAAVVRSRHRRAVVRARRLLLDGDVDGARAAAQDALLVRPDLRTRAVAWGLAAAPSGLREAYRAKGVLSRRARRLTARASQRASGASSS